MHKQFDVNFGTKLVPEQNKITINFYQI